MKIVYLVKICKSIDDNICMEICIFIDGWVFRKEVIFNEGCKFSEDFRN